MKDQYAAYLERLSVAIQRRYEAATSPRRSAYERVIHEQCEAARRRADRLVRRWLP